MNKSWYFKLFGKDVIVSLPQNPFAKVITLIIAVMLVADIFTGNLFGILFNLLFLGLFTTQIH